MLITRKAALGVVSLVAAAAALLVWLPTAPRAADPAPSNLPQQEEAQEANEKRSEPVSGGMELGRETAKKPAPSASVLLSFEEQQVADRAYAMLGVELEPLNESERKRVEKLGFKGGLKVVDATAILIAAYSDPKAQLTQESPFQVGDLLVGLHSWATTDLASLSKLLERPDLKRLSPLKFYVVRKFEVPPQASQPRGGRGGFGGEMGDFGGGFGGEYGGDAPPKPVYEDRVVRGRILVRIVEEPVAMTPTPTGPPEMGFPPLYNPGDKSSEPSAFYDGKPFDHWQSMWRTELMAEKRLACVEALAAFGRNGRAQEATDAIFEVAGEYDFTGGTDGSFEGQLKKAIVEFLNDAPEQGAKHWFPGLMDRYEQNPDQWRGLVSQLLRRERFTDAQQIDRLATMALEHEDPVIRKAAILAVCHARGPELAGRPLEVIRKILADQDQSILGAAMDGLTIKNDNGKYEFVWLDEAYPLLFYKNPHSMGMDDQFRMGIRKLLPFLRDKDVPEVTKRLVAEMDSAKDDDQRIAAIRALAAIGQKAKPLAKEKLMSLIVPETPDSVRIAAAYAANQMGEKSRSGILTVTRADGTMKLLEVYIEGLKDREISSDKRSNLLDSLTEKVNRERQQVYR